MLCAYYSDDLPKIKLKMSVADSLKKALVKLKEQEKDKPVSSDGKCSVVLHTCNLAGKVTNTSCTCHSLRMDNSLHQIKHYPVDSQLLSTGQGSH